MTDLFVLLRPPCIFKMKNGSKMKYAKCDLCVAGAVDKPFKQLYSALYYVHNSVDCVDMSVLSSRNY